jgi:hypothetical protein
MRHSLKFLGFLIVLTGCSTCPAVNTCLPVKNWTNSEEAQMSHDIAALPQNSSLIGVMIDYARMRAEAKACAEN